MKPKDELTALLSKLVKLNSGFKDQTVETMPPDVAFWFGWIAVSLAERWNNGEHKVLGKDLLSFTKMKAGVKNIAPDKWAKAIRTLCSPGESLHFLFVDEFPDQFLINQPKLEEFWLSDHAKAFLLVYGGPSTIRTPSSERERKWCDMLRSLEKELTRNG